MNDDKLTDAEIAEAATYIDMAAIVAYVRKPCTCARGPLTVAGLLAHEQRCPVFHALEPRIKLAWFLVTRTGKTRIEGGEGVRWACTCTEGDEDCPTCKHINDLFASNVKELDTFAESQSHSHDSFPGSVIVLTPFGGSILHAVWAANALRADPAGAQAQGVASGGTGFVPSALAQPIQIYRGPNPPPPQPWKVPQVDPWVTPATLRRRRWWHRFIPFK